MTCRRAATVVSVPAAGDLAEPRRESDGEAARDVRNDRAAVRRARRTAEPLLDPIATDPRLGEVEAHERAQEAVGDDHVDARLRRVVRRAGRGPRRSTDRSWRPRRSRADAPGRRPRRGCGGPRSAGSRRRRARAWRRARPRAMRQRTSPCTRSISYSGAWKVSSFSGCAAAARSSARARCSGPGSGRASRARESASRCARGAPGIRASRSRSSSCAGSVTTAVCTERTAPVASSSEVRLRESAITTAGRAAVQLTQQRREQRQRRSRLRPTPRRAGWRSSAGG